MSRRYRRLAAVLMAAVMLLATVTPAIAAREAEEALTPARPMWDLVILRPAGFVALAVGTGMFVAFSPVVLLTRPDSLPTAFDQLVLSPGRYVWADPLGTH